MHLYALVKLLGSYSFSDTNHGLQNASFDNFSQKRVKFIMNADKTPQLDLIMGETAKLSIAYAIDNFQKAERSIGKTFQNHHTVLDHFNESWVLSFGATKWSGQQTSQQWAIEHAISGLQVWLALCRSFKWHAAATATMVTETTACWVKTRPRRRNSTRWVLLLNQSICLVWGAWPTRPTFAQSSSRTALHLACWTYVNEASPYNADIRWNCWNLSEQRLTIRLMSKTNLDALVVAFWKGPLGGVRGPVGGLKIQMSKTFVQYVQSWELHKSKPRDLHMHPSGEPHAIEMRYLISIDSVFKTLSKYGFVVIIIITN